MKASSGSDDKSDTNMFDDFANTQKSKGSKLDIEVHPKLMTLDSKQVLVFNLDDDNSHVQFQRLEDGFEFRTRLEGIAVDKLGSKVYSISADGVNESDITKPDAQPLVYPFDEKDHRGILRAMIKGETKKTLVTAYVHGQEQKEIRITIIVEGKRATVFRLTEEGGQKKAQQLKVFPGSFIFVRTNDKACLVG